MMRSKFHRLRAGLAGLSVFLLLSGFVIDVPDANAQSALRWAYEWPKTDFKKTSIDLRDIISGGPPKDGIPSIDKPRFMAANKVNQQDLAPTEPVIGVIINGKAKAYPLRILTWHEIVNDELAGVPITVTYCPLCNSTIVFDRRLDDHILDFGTTGKLRNSDMVMYDRQTESWWQQFLGEGIVGELMGKRLKTIPARLESFEKFLARAPKGRVLIPTDRNMRSYGRNPYESYDSASAPFLYGGDLPDYIEPMIRVVVADGKAWSMPLIGKRGKVEDGDFVLSWTAGQNSALDSSRIRKGRDVGNVIVQRKGAGGEMEHVVYDVTFAFVYHAFHGGKKIVIN